MRRPAILSLALLLPLVALAAGVRHFDVVASFVPEKKGVAGKVSVMFRPLDPDVRVNETPAPRLKLDLAQAVLVDRQASATREVPDYDPLTAKYLDLAKPVLFPVEIAPLAPRGEQVVKGSVVFFYCSKREAWCRRGTAELEIPVDVR